MTFRLYVYRLNRIIKINRKRTETSPAREQQESRRLISDLMTFNKIYERAS